jgi:hypothetical protein
MTLIDRVKLKLLRNGPLNLVWSLSNIFTMGMLRSLDLKAATTSAS